MPVPNVNIPARIRFSLYLLGAVALLTVSWAFDNAWVGDPEVRYVTGLAALLHLLAAAKTGDPVAPDAVTGMPSDRPFHGSH